jgi:hypothetical protein
MTSMSNNLYSKNGDRLPAVAGLDRAGHINPATAGNFSSLLKKTLAVVYRSRYSTAVFLLSAIFLMSCGVYTFKDISIDYTKVKTIKISYFENKSRFVDPQFSPQLTDKLRQKITQQTRLTQVQTDDASYDVSGYVSDFNISTAGVSNQQAASNRLTVTVHLIFKNRVDDKQSKETDVSRNFDYSASLNFSDAEQQLLPTIISNMTDEIFNAIFSNW